MGKNQAIRLCQTSAGKRTLLRIWGEGVRKICGAYLSIPMYLPAPAFAQKTFVQVEGQDGQNKILPQASIARCDAQNLMHNPICNILLAMQHKPTLFLIKLQGDQTVTNRVAFLQVLSYKRAFDRYTCSNHLLKLEPHQLFFGQKDQDPNPKINSYHQVTCAACFEPCQR